MVVGDGRWLVVSVRTTRIREEGYEEGGRKRLEVFGSVIKKVGGLGSRFIPSFLWH